MQRSKHSRELRSHAVSTVIYGCHRRCNVAIQRILRRYIRIQKYPALAAARLAVLHYDVRPNVGNIPCRQFPGKDRVL